MENVGARGEALRHDSDKKKGQYEAIEGVPVRVLGAYVRWGGAWYGRTIASYSIEKGAMVPHLPVN